MYQDILTIKELGLPVSEFSRLSRIDKKALFYFRIMEGYYWDKANKKAKKKAAQEQKRKDDEQKMLKNLPKQSRLGRLSRGNKIS